MWWILRRARLTGASFFNSTSNNNKNNNLPSKPGTSKFSTSNSFSEPRPPRKNYNQLSSKEQLDNLNADIKEDASGRLDQSDASSEAEDRDTANVCPPCTHHNHRHHDHYNNNLRNDDDFSDTDYDEALTCNVCDRSFQSRRQLSDHQQKKRHFGCSACDSLFPSLMALEHHKEEFQHWSEEDDFCSDSDGASDDSQPSEDCDRLL